MNTNTGNDLYSNDKVSGVHVVCKGNSLTVFIQGQELRASITCTLIEQWGYYRHILKK